MKKFGLTAEAAGDITEIFDYIAEDSIDAAQRVRAEISGVPSMAYSNEAPPQTDELYWGVGGA